MVDRMKQLQRNTVTNADIIDGALVLKRYDGSRLAIDSGTSGLEVQTAPEGSKYIVVDDEGGSPIVVMSSGNYEGVAIIGVGTAEDVENEVGTYVSLGDEIELQTSTAGRLTLHTAGVDLAVPDGQTYLHMQSDGATIMGATDSMGLNVSAGGGVQHQLQLRADRARLASSTNTADAWVSVDSDVEVRVGEGGHNLTIVNLPTADPHVVGAVWNSSGVLHISAG